MQRFVVTGTGRSGTRWASEVLGVGHQAMFTGDGFVDSDAAGDVSFWAASQNLEGWRVVLLVRDPRLVVASWLASGEFEGMLGSGHWRLWQHCMRLDRWLLEDANDTADRIARYWWAVNFRMAQRADVVMRLEDVTPQKLGEACETDWQDVPAPESSTTSADLKAGIYPDGGRLAREFGYDC